MSHENDAITRGSKLQSDTCWTSFGGTTVCSEQTSQNLVRQIDIFYGDHQMSCLETDNLIRDLSLEIPEYTAKYPGDLVLDMDTQYQSNVDYPISMAGRPQSRNIARQSYGSISLNEAVPEKINLASVPVVSNTYNTPASVSRWLDEAPKDSACILENLWSTEGN